MAVISLISDEMQTFLPEKAKSRYNAHMAIQQEHFQRPETL